jgi:hypothetical protein
MWCLVGQALQLASNVDCALFGACWQYSVQVIGKLVANHKASITCLITLPSKSGWKTSAEQQASAGVAQQDKDPASGGQKSRRSTTVQDPAVEYIPSSDLVLAGGSVCL